MNSDVLRWSVQIQVGLQYITYMRDRTIYT